MLFMATIRPTYYFGVWRRILVADNGLPVEYRSVAGSRTQLWALIFPRSSGVKQCPIQLQIILRRNLGNYIRIISRSHAVEKISTFWYIHTNWHLFAAAMKDYIDIDSLIGVNSLHTYLHNYKYQKYFFLLILNKYYRRSLLHSEPSLACIRLWSGLHWKFRFGKSFTNALQRRLWYRENVFILNIT